MIRNGYGLAGRVAVPLGRRTVFGAFEIGFDTHELLKKGLRVKLPPKSFELLTALLERAGSVVTREELRTRLWREETQIDFETGLNTAAHRLRATLGDTAENPRYIETLPRIGYRFIGPIVENQAVSGERQHATVASDDLDAVRRIVETVQGFDAAAQQRVLRWAAEKLGLLSSI